MPSPPNRQEVESRSHRGHSRDKEVAARSLDTEIVARSSDRVAVARNLPAPDIPAPGIEDMADTEHSLDRDMVVRMAMVPMGVG